MQTPKITDGSFKYFFVLLGMSIPIYFINKSYENNATNKLKTEVLAKDSLRYKRVEQETKNMNSSKRKLTWINEIREMEDSLRIDSAAKKAYFEGAQMVRDSINNLKK